MRPALDSNKGETHDATCNSGLSSSPSPGGRPAVLPNLASSTTRRHHRWNQLTHSGSLAFPGNIGAFMSSRDQIVLQWRLRHGLPILGQPWINTHRLSQCYRSRQTGALALLVSIPTVIDEGGSFSLSLHAARTQPRRPVFRMRHFDSRHSQLSHWQTSWNLGITPCSITRSMDRSIVNWWEVVAWQVVIHPPGLYLGSPPTFTRVSPQTDAQQPALSAYPVFERPAN